MVFGKTKSLRYFLCMKFLIRWILQLSTWKAPQFLQATWTNWWVYWKYNLFYPFSCFLTVNKADLFFKHLNSVISVLIALIKKQCKVFLRNALWPNLYSSDFSCKLQVVIPALPKTMTGPIHQGRSAWWPWSLLHEVLDTEQSGIK